MNPRPPHLSPRPPIVVWCNHGIQGEQGDLVQRYRWHAHQGKWIPSDNTAEANTFVAHHGQHYNAVCKQCARLVAMRERGAQVALTRIWEAGDSGKLDVGSVPLSVLQHAYEALPPALR